MIHIHLGYYEIVLYYFQKSNNQHQVIYYPYQYCCIISQFSSNICKRNYQNMSTNSSLNEYLKLYKHLVTNSDHVFLHNWHSSWCKSHLQIKTARVITEIHNFPMDLAFKLYLIYINKPTQMLNNYIKVLIFSRGPSSWNPFLWVIKTCSSYILNTMAFDDLSIKRARASEAMALT